jgi:hypothetical protein
LQAMTGTCWQVSYDTWMYRTSGQSQVTSANLLARLLRDGHALHTLAHLLWDALVLLVRHLGADLLGNRLAFLVGDLGADLLRDALALLARHLGADLLEDDLVAHPAQNRGPHADIHSQQVLQLGGQARGELEAQALGREVVIRREYLAEGRGLHHQPQLGLPALHHAGVHVAGGDLEPGELEPLQPEVDGLPGHPSAGVQEAAGQHMGAGPQDGGVGRHLLGAAEQQI